MSKKSFYEMMRIIETGATIPPTPLNSSSNPPPNAQANPTGTQQSQQNQKQQQQGTVQQKQNDAQQKQDATNKLNFIKQLKDLLKRNLGVTI